MLSHLKFFLNAFIKEDIFAKIENSARNISLADYIAFVFILLGNLLAYIYFGVAPTLDQEALGSISDRMHTITMNYLGAARPMLWFISAYIGSGSFLPLLNIIIACICLSLAAFMVARMLTAKRPVETVVIALIFSTSPF